MSAFLGGALLKRTFRQRLAGHWSKFVYAMTVLMRLCSRNMREQTLYIHCVCFTRTFCFLLWHVGMPVRLNIKPRTHSSHMFHTTFIKDPSTTTTIPPTPANRACIRYWRHGSSLLGGAKIFSLLLLQNHALRRNHPKLSALLFEGEFPHFLLLLITQSSNNRMQQTSEEMDFEEGTQALAHFPSLLYSS